jgi:hypothetical protein
LKFHQVFSRYCLFYILLLLIFISCKEKERVVPSIKAEYVEKVEAIIDSTKSTVHTRFAPPIGFTRIKVNPASFASYLRNFPLLDINQQVHLYDGSLKWDQSVHASVFDIDVGKRDLQQCADAVMRLRAEYLLGQKKHAEIAFNFTNGWRFEYEKWRAGNDLVVRGNKTYWKPSAGPKGSYKDFRKYMDWVFMYAGTFSLSKELNPKRLKDIEIGDVFILGGSPGHAVLVIDVAVNTSTKDKAFMLAQSYMPAQQIHVLKNKGNMDVSPWYLLSEIGSSVNTPEWTFGIDQLMGF